MKTNSQNTGNNRPNENNKQQQINQSPKDKRSNKNSARSAYIKNMPPIEGARPGIL